ncbi:MAG: LytR/AlgR family response regulator transcription factor [Oscillospiraceae bacterium]
MRYFICDDNVLFAEDLARRISAEDPVGSVEVFTTITSLMFHIEGGERADAVFLDIVNKDGSGLEAAKKIRRKDPSIRIVFVTGYAEDFSQAIFDCPVGSEPAAFLAKPVSDKYLHAALSKLKSAEKRASVLIPVGSSRNTSYIDAGEIIYIVSERRQMRIFTESGEKSCYGRVADMMKLLPDSFCRCHRSYIINLDKIAHINGRTGVVMKNGSRIPVGGVFSEAFLDAVTRRYAGSSFWGA